MNSAELAAKLEQLSDLRLRAVVSRSGLKVELSSDEYYLGKFVDCERVRRLVVDVLTEAGAFNGEARGQTNMLSP